MVSTRNHAVIGLLFTISSLCLFTSSPANAGHLCTEQSARAIARAYMLSSPFSSGNILGYITQNREHFVQGGNAIRCARALGSQLVTAGINAYDPKAYEKAMGVGPAEFAPKVAESINSGATDLMLMGQELHWLAQVLPPAIRGNYVPYNTTGTPTRQQIRQVLPIFNVLCQTDPAMCQMVRGIMQQFEPIIEEQIVMLAMMLN